MAHSAVDGVSISDSVAGRSSTSIFKQLRAEPLATHFWNNLCSTYEQEFELRRRVRAASQKDEEEAMEKTVGLQKNSKKVFLSVLVAVSILWTGSPVHAVGPYFENESPREQGPNPAWPRPDEPLWSPSKPQILSIESLKKGDIILRNSKQSGKAETTAPGVVDAPADKYVVRR